MYTGRRLLAFVLGFLMALGATVPVAAQTTAYTKLNVKGRVQLEIPSDWIINDAEHRQRVRDLAQSMTGMKMDHTASLSISSFPLPSKIWVRVSFIAVEPPITQSELQKELVGNEKQLLKELSDFWKVESPAMWSGLAKNGVREVGRPSVAIEQFGGQTAMVIRYARTSYADSSQTVRVAQYHVVLGSEKALVTLSYVDGDPSILGARDRLKGTISIK
jgi:hypothetical protein